MKEVFPRVFTSGKFLYTLNSVPGKKVYGEKLVTDSNVEYRGWDPNRSKLGAAILKGLKHLPIKPGGNVLYLGAAEGTTISHVSDIIGDDGAVVGIDVAPRVMAKLIEVSKDRENIVPLLADCNYPEKYKEYDLDFDVIFQDVAQSNQVQILVVNAKEYLKPGKFAMLSFKIMSVSSTADISETLSKAREQLKEVFIIEEEVDLAPFETEHKMFLLKMK